MKYKGFTREFVNFINNYKIKETKKIINEIKMNLCNLLSISDVRKLNDEYKNIFVNLNLNNVNLAIEQIVIEESPLFESQSSEQWKNKLNRLHKAWEEKQTEENYKAQTLKNKIIKEVKKTLEDSSSNSALIDEITKKIKDRAFDQIWLDFNLESFLDSIKTTLTEEQINRIEDIKQEWVDELDIINKKYDYANWLDMKSIDAKRVSLSTHVAKLTHSSISTSTSSFYFDKKEIEPKYLTTSSLTYKEIDVSQSAAFEPIGKLLKLEFDNALLADRLKKGDVSCFSIFAQNEQQLANWRKYFSQAFADNQVASHSLSKQVFYPLNINKKDEYHLISVLASSSLDQAIFYETQRTHSKSHYHKLATEVKNQRKISKFHPNLYITYPNIAILKVTASNPSNVSPLNGSRGGRRYLLRSEPPQWRSRLKPPTNQESLFYGEFNRRAWESAHYLQNYLLDLQAQKSNKRIRDNVKKSVNHIIDILFNYVVEIQNMTELAGWSETAEKLKKKSHQLWLDPYRLDDAFQQARKRGDWQDEVCRDFGSWLNQKLRHDKMNFEKIEAKTWAKMLKKRLREFERDLEAIQ